MTSEQGVSVVVPVEVREVLFAALRSYTLTNMGWADDPDTGFPLVDLMSNDGTTIATGEAEMRVLADHLAEALSASPAGSGQGSSAQEPIPTEQGDGAVVGWHEALGAILDLSDPNKRIEEPRCNLDKVWDLAHDQLAAFVAASSVSGGTVRERLCWPSGRFSVTDPDPSDDHGPIYLVCPTGLMVDFSSDPRPGLDGARVEWLAETLNAALSAATTDQRGGGEA